MKKLDHIWDVKVNVCKRKVSSLQPFDGGDFPISSDSSVLPVEYECEMWFFYVGKGWAKSVVCQNFLFSSEDCFWSYWTIVIFWPLNIETCRNSVVTDGYHIKLNLE